MISYVECVTVTERPALSHECRTAVATSGGRALCMATSLCYKYRAVSVSYQLFMHSNCVEFMLKSKTCDDIEVNALIVLL